MISNDRSRNEHLTKPWRPILEDLLGSKPEQLHLLEENPAWDDLLSWEGHRFAVQRKARADTAAVSAALEQVRAKLEQAPPEVHPLLVVDHMGQTGSELANRAKVDWIDLAGNAHIVHVPRLRIVVEGKKPRSRPRGRKSNIFATKSSRLAHWLLLHQSEAQSHGELAEATALDKGHLSRILARMEDQLLVRREEGGFVARKPATLLDAWREAYGPPCERILKGVIPTRSGVETVQLLADAFQAAGIRHAFSGLAAAWFWDQFADFRLASCFVDGILSNAVLDAVGLVETDRGPNVWVMEQADPVAFLGSKEFGGVHVTSPWFTYVDLAVHPERAKEAAARLRANHLKLEQWP